jgi:hypothetical protein
MPYEGGGRIRSLLVRRAITIRAYRIDQVDFAQFDSALLRLDRKALAEVSGLRIFTSVFGQNEFSHVLSLPLKEDSPRQEGSCRSAKFLQDMLTPHILFSDWCSWLLESTALSIGQKR